MELSSQLTCECNGKLYKNNATLKAHKLSNIHLAWEHPRTIKDLQITNNKLEIDLAKERREKDSLIGLNNLLIQKLRENG